MQYSLESQQAETVLTVTWVNPSRIMVTMKLISMKDTPRVNDTKIVAAKNLLAASSSW